MEKNKFGHHVENHGAVLPICCVRVMVKSEVASQGSDNITHCKKTNKKNINIVFGQWECVNKFQAEQLQGLSERMTFSR